jgi:biofilm protein TabA
MRERARRAGSVAGLAAAGALMASPPTTLLAGERMVTGSIGEWRTTVGTEGLAKAFAFLQRSDLGALEPGRYPIDGDDVFALVSVGETRAADAAEFEGHRRYVDVQCVVDGQEAIGVASTASLVTAVPYDEAKDIEFFVTPPTFQKVALHAGQFAVFSPGQAHLPSLNLEGPHQVRKIVVKVSVAYLKGERGESHP